MDTKPAVVTETLSQTVERQAKEIERLRGLLREVADGYLRATYGSSHEDVAQINDLWRKVRGELGND
jgi:hypothetical protein